MSSTVPTISISYSIKARGINRDLFGDLPVVLDTPSLNLQTLTEKLELLQSEEKRIKEILEKTLPEWRARESGAVGKLASHCSPKARFSLVFGFHLGRQRVVWVKEGAVNR